MGITDVPNAEVKPCLLRAKSQIRKTKIVSVVCHRFFCFFSFIYIPSGTAAFLHYFSVRLL